MEDRKRGGTAKERSEEGRARKEVTERLLPSDTRTRRSEKERSRRRRIR
jgi:hypothetical protein